MSGPTIGEVLRAAVRDLQSVGIPDAAGDARHLVRHAFGIGPGGVAHALAEPAPRGAIAAFEEALAARKAHQPVAQITGRRDFWKHEFCVTPAVLDPRPETETLVEAALGAPFTRLLDLGTGSGCILLSLLAERPAASGLGVDASPEALAVAQKNARRLGLAARAELRLSDWFSAVTERFDLIVANPPYVPLAEIAALAPEVRLWEPLAALSPGKDGLEAYRAIAASIAARLEPCGRVLVETGPGQAKPVAALFQTAGLSLAAVHRDIDGRGRVVDLRGPAA